MKITYKPNPLDTTVELDEHERRELWLKIKIEELEDLIVGASMYLREDPKWFDLSKARDELDLSYVYSDKVDENGKDVQSKLDKRCDEMFGYLTEALMESHAGDCTCFPCSCTKCHAEGMLGIDTTKGLGKHEGSKILYAFGAKDEKDRVEGESIWLEKERTLDEVLERLSVHVPNTDPKWTEHEPRWKRESENAYAWLLNYKNTHFSKE